MTTGQDRILTENKKALVNPYLDFWLLGGFSLLLYFILLLNETNLLSGQPQVSRHISNIGPTFTTLTLFINFPHFIWSYKLAYSQPWSFVKRNWFQLLFVPTLMIFLFFLAFIFWYFPVSVMNLSKVLAAFGGVFGINQRISIYPNFGSQILGLLLVFQFGIVGWHYVKQTFGTMMTYSYYDSYELSGGQRNLIKWSLYGIWWVFFLKANEGLKSFTTWGMTYYSLDLPPILTLFAQIYLVITLVLTLTLVFFMNWWRNGKFPTPAVIVPFVAMYIWFPAWDALFISDYFALVVPCAHSLQYLCFVYKVERESKKDFSSRKLFWLASWLILSIVIGGFIIIEVLPSYLDDYVLSKGLMTAGFFTASVQIFINVHHYFIDNAIWQSKNKEIKGHLFS